MKNAGQSDALSCEILINLTFHPLNYFSRGNSSAYIKNNFSDVGDNRFSCKNGIATGFKASGLNAKK